MIVLQDIQTILTKIKQNDNTAFEELFNRYKSSVFFTAYSIVKSEAVAEDILQDTFLAFLDNIHKIKPNTDPKNYLITISKNKAISYYRKHKREIKLDAYENEGMYGCEEFQYDNSMDLIKKIEALLKPIEFQIILLHTINNLTHKEISSILKKPIGTVTWTYQNAIKKLQKELKYYE